jgi:hypothetical protein
MLQRYVLTCDRSVTAFWAPPRSQRPGQGPRSPHPKAGPAYKPSVSPDVLHFIITRELHSPVYLASCSALSSDHLPVLIDTMCRSSVHHPPDRSDFRRPNWAIFKTHLVSETAFNPELRKGMAINMC